MPVLDTQGGIASALALPTVERIAVLDAIHVSLADPSIDHPFSDEDAGEVAAAWSDEVAHRLANIDIGRVKSLPAEEAERMIPDAAPPRI